MDDEAAMDGPNSGRPAGRRHQRLSEMVAATLGKRIVNGQYQPGDTLPTEPAVQAEFGVSRTAVREAIRLLSAKGLTASRPKIGTRVRPDGRLEHARCRTCCAGRSNRADRRIRRRPLRDARDHGAGGLRRWPRSGRPPEDIAALGAAMDGIQKDPRGGPEQIAADIDFHMAILSLAQSDAASRSAP